MFLFHIIVLNDFGYNHKTIYGRRPYCLRLGADSYCGDRIWPASPRNLFTSRRRCKVARLTTKIKSSFVLLNKDLSSPGKIGFILFALSWPVLGFSQSKTSMSAAEIYDHSKNSVVVIITADKNDKPTGQGSGFIVSKDRIVTNHHVLAGAPQALVVYADGKSVVVEGIVADSSSRDIIIISAKTGQRSPLRLGDELSIHEGDPIYAIGAPKGLQLSITNGIVSGFRQMDEKFMLQSTAPIAPGSSGGPLFNKEGYVVGVTTSLLADTPGVYFSIGSGDVSRLLRTPNPAIISLSTWSETTAEAAVADESKDMDSIQKLIDARDYAKAKDQLETLLVKQPDDLVLNKLRGEVALFEGDNKTALLRLKTAVEGNPGDAEAKVYYGFGLFLAGQYDDAAKYQEAAVKEIPKAFNMGYLAQTYYAQKKFKDADVMALKALALEPKEETSLSVIAGNIYWGRSSSQISWTDIQARLAVASPDSFWVEVERSRKLLNQYKDNDAISLLEKAKKEIFPDPAAYGLLTYAYERNNRIGMARDTIQEGLSEYPDDPGLLDTNVMVSLLSHDDMGAWRSASRLNQVAPGTRHEMYASCLYTYGTGQPSVAVANCSRVIQAYPGDHTAHSNLGWAALDADQIALASKEFSQAYSLVKDQWKELPYIQVIDLVWGTAIADYYIGDKKDCKKLLQFLRKDYPTALTVTGLQQLPLIWSAKTMTRIETILRDVKP
jgi:tetratricopeptide (TPR) repeat protein